MLICLFLGNMSYLYGSLYRSDNRINKLNIVAIDYDGGVIGQSLSAAYTALEGSDFPGLEFHPATEYPTVSSIRDAVCRGDYWGAVFTQ